MRTVATVRVADGKGQTVGRDRANAEWRFFRDDQECRIGATWSYHAATFIAAASWRLSADRALRMRYAAMAAVRRIHERQLEARGRVGPEPVHLDIPVQSRQRGQGQAGNPVVCRRAGRHQFAFFIPCHAGPAFGPERAGSPQAARCADRSGEQGSGEDLALPQRTVRARCIFLS